MDYAEQPYRRLPDEGTRLESIFTGLRLTIGKYKRSIERYPKLSPLDEYPLVPYLIEDGLRFQYDSSSIASWLDDRSEDHSRLLIPSQGSLKFIVRLIDEAFDEFGLYMVHHQRWVTSAATNNAGARLAHEFRQLLPFFCKNLLAEYFSQRQVRRLPYLFSVAPYAPSPWAGWPATHQLLDEAWLSYLNAMETLLSSQPYILGGRFTLADASAYGQLSMNLKDKTTSDRLLELAPVTHRWLCHIRDGGHVGSDGDLVLSTKLKPLLDIIMMTFVPLMEQNKSAYSEAVKSGETLFNEAAFNHGKCLYAGELNGHAFRSVVKTFQVEVWQGVCENWKQLSDAERNLLKSFLGDASCVFESQMCS